MLKGQRQMLCNHITPTSLITGRSDGTGSRSVLPNVVRNLLQDSI